MEEFCWDEYNAEHVRRHGVEPLEAEDALRDPDALAVEASNSGNEQRWATLGETENGRLLFVVFTRRRKKFRVITARPPKQREAQRYRRQQR